MKNYLFLKEKLELFFEKEDVTIRIEEVSKDGLVIKIKDSNYYLVEKFLSKYDMYECEILNNGGIILLVRFLMKERFR